MRDTNRASVAPCSGATLAYDIETIAPETPDGSFPPWPTHLPVALGWARVEQRSGQWSFQIDAMVADHPDDPALLIEADRQLGTATRAVTYNGRGFDSLVLRLSAQRQRCYNLRALAEHAGAPRYAGEHADLADYFASYTRKVALAEICGALGIPVKTSVAGGDVAALWQAGERETIRTYVMEDATATLCAWFSWSAARAGDETLVTRPMMALARTIEHDPGLAHLQPFLGCTLMSWARPRALRADIGAALARAQKRLERDADERAFAASG